MRFVRFLLVLACVGLLFAFGFGYGRWYSTRPAAKKSGRAILYYVDAMHPWYKSDKPGLAPDCGMKLEPVYAAAGEQHDPNAGTPPANAVEVTQEQQHLIGMRYGEAEWSAGSESIRAAGRVTPDETMITRVQARTDGWITEVSADFTGKFVSKGQPLLTLYSPELFAAQQEYLLALKARTIMQHSSMQESMANNDALAEAAKRRLLLLNLTEAQIAGIEQSQKPVQSVVLYAPATGYVVTRNAFPGQRVTAETELYTLVDLSGVWVMADVFEADAQRVRPGQSARISIPGDSSGGNSVSAFARVTYVQPQIDPVTRTLKVRLELANPKMQFRPEMLVDADIALAGVRRLSVPAGAVLDAGTSKTIFVDRGQGYFEQRMVETGARYTDSSGDRVEIVKGLKAGEKIVTSGTFLLNSESQMKAAGGGGMADMPGMPAKPGAATRGKPANGGGTKPARTKPEDDMPDMPGMPQKKTGSGDKK
jgi:Cu(I)/Ag(I) efflux system membrane fusion protein